jgi:hypothetical protein
MYLYLVSTEQNQTKIGISKNVEKHFKTIQAHNLQRLTLSFALEFDNEQSARLAETALHNHFEDFRIHYEWFNVSPKEIILVIRLATAISSHLKDVKVNKKFPLDKNMPM